MHVGYSYVFSLTKKKDFDKTLPFLFQTINSITTMTATELGAAPVLSTPDAHIFEQSAPSAHLKPQLSDEQLFLTYEIGRTVDEIRAGRWKRVALQFPDHMLVDAPRVFQALSRGLKQARRSARAGNSNGVNESAKVGDVTQQIADVNIVTPAKDIEERLYILADTSYGACCVDEVAAEHADADVVVHYGRSCLSPTARLPVIYVFTKPPLDLTAVISSFTATYPDLEQKIILMADIPFNSYLPELSSKLKTTGYTNIFTTSIIHNTSSLLPNRTVPEEVTTDTSLLKSYALFHISDPPPSLLLTLHSRTGPIHIFPTSAPATSPVAIATHATSHLPLRRRYALLSKLATEPIIGILLNTLSVASYLQILAHLKRIIAAAGKKSYTFVVGKVNAAKVANFSEVGGWVVVGCWESSLFENGDFWRPVVTPGELEWALGGVEGRVWTGEWSGDFGDVLRRNRELESTAADEEVNGNSAESTASTNDTAEANGTDETVSAEMGAHSDSDSDSEEESEPPEFDLRTGRYISHSRPMGRQASKPFTSTSSTTSSSNTSTSASTSQAKIGSSSIKTLAKRAPSSLATINGIVSPAAEYFKNKRSWQGLGSDFEVKYDDDDGDAGIGGGGIIGGGEVIGAKMEQGRRGVARGYVVDDDDVVRR